MTSVATPQIAASSATKAHSAAAPIAAIDPMAVSSVAKAHSAAAPIAGMDPRAVSSVAKAASGEYPIPVEKRAVLPYVPPLQTASEAMSKVEVKQKRGRSIGKKILPQHAIPDQASLGGGGGTRPDNIYDPTIGAGNRSVTSVYDGFGDAHDVFASSGSWADEDANLSSSNKRGRQRKSLSIHSRKVLLSWIISNQCESQLVGSWIEFSYNDYISAAHASFCILSFPLRARFLSGRSRLKMV